MTDTKKTKDAEKDPVKKSPEEEIAELKEANAVLQKENTDLQKAVEEKKASGKSAKRLQFSATVDGKKRKFEVVSPTVEVTGKGKFNTEDLVKDKEHAEVLATLLAKGSGVFREV